MTESLFADREKAAMSKTTLIVLDTGDRRVWVTDSPPVVARALERGGFVPFDVVSGSGRVWVNAARVRELGERDGRN